LQELQCGRAVSCLKGEVSEFLQNFDDEHAYARLIVYHEHRLA
jgi:hypothetical protein